MGMWFLLISAMPQSPQLPTPTATWHPAAPGLMVGSLLGSVYGASCYPGKQNYFDTRDLNLRPWGLSMRNSRTTESILNSLLWPRQHSQGEKGSFGSPSFFPLALAGSYTKCVPPVWAVPRFSVSLLQEAQPDT